MLRTVSGFSALTHSRCCLCTKGDHGEVRVRVRMILSFGPRLENRPGFPYAECRRVNLACEIGPSEYSGARDWNLWSSFFLGFFFFFFSSMTEKSCWGSPQTYVKGYVLLHMLQTCALDASVWNLSGGVFASQAWMYQSWSIFFFHSFPWYIWKDIHMRAATYAEISVKVWKYKGIFFLLQELEKILKKAREHLVVLIWWLEVCQFFLSM
mgnify:CR=1 FL=1